MTPLHGQPKPISIQLSLPSTYSHILRHITFFSLNAIFFLVELPSFFLGLFITNFARQASPGAGAPVEDNDPRRGDKEAG